MTVKYERCRGSLSVTTQGCPTPGRRGYSLKWPPPERAIYFRLQIYERVGISPVEVYKRVGKSVILVSERVEKGLQMNLRLYKLETTVYFCN